jgi:hypothetical protein
MSVLRELNRGLTSRVHQDGRSLVVRHGGRRRRRHSCLTFARHTGVTIPWRAGRVPATLAPIVITSAGLSVCNLALTHTGLLSLTVQLTYRTTQVIYTFS